MNIKCLLGHHNWSFVYNHGMPRGIGLDNALRMFQEGKTHSVYECTRCGKQAKKVNGEMVILSRAEMQDP